jgi:thiopurine S-methyltransferase
MDSEYWKKRWRDGELSFHQTEFHPGLVTYFPIEPKAKVFVPFCGKSRDMLWLLAQGHRVVGAEISPIACEAFFRENQIPFTAISSGEFTHFKSEMADLWCGDFFRLPPRAVETCTAVYDRAALVALPPEMQKKYVTQLKNLGLVVPTLLVSFTYDQKRVDGPAFSVPFEVLQRLYGDLYDIRELSSRNDPPMSPKFKGIPIQERVYFLTPKI